MTKKKPARVRTCDGWTSTKYEDRTVEQAVMDRFDRAPDYHDGQIESLEREVGELKKVVAQMAGMLFDHTQPEPAEYAKIFGISERNLIVGPDPEFEEDDGLGKYV